MDGREGRGQQAEGWVELMHFNEVRAFLASQIAADTALAALGAAKVWDLMQDPNDAARDLGTLLKATGVLFEIGFPELRNMETLLSGVTVADAYCEVFVAESTTITHTPAFDSLIPDVVAAICKRQSATQKPVRAGTEVQGSRSGGMVIHRFDFFIPVLVK